MGIIPTLHRQILILHRRISTLRRRISTLHGRAFRPWLEAGRWERRVRLEVGRSGASGLEVGWSGSSWLEVGRHRAGGGRWGWGGAGLEVGARGGSWRWGMIYIMEV